MIRSICELVAPHDVGVALPHEHVLHNVGAIVAASSSSPDQGICFEDLIDYRRSPYAHGGRNLLLQNEDEAFRELEKLRQLGGSKRKPLVVDVTLPAEGRDVFVKERLNLAERLKELHLLTVSTFEIDRINEKFSFGLAATEQSERIAKTLEAELMFGIDCGGSVSFPGAMYQQIHASTDELSAKEQVLAHGLALAQARTHAPLYLSFSIDKTSCEENAELEQIVRVWIRTLLDAGAERKMLVVCHADRWCRGDFEGAGYSFLLELFASGVSVLFDMIGLLAVSDVMMINPCFASASSLTEPLGRDNQEPPSDSCLVAWIANLVKAKTQYLYQTILSTNVHQRIQYRRYGGGGYSYLFKHFKEHLLREGVSAAQWDQVARTNVVNLLAWYVPPEAPPIPKNYLQCSICGNYFEPIEGEYFTKFTFVYCGIKCLRRHSRQKFAPLPAKV